MWATSTGSQGSLGLGLWPPRHQASHLWQPPIHMPMPTEQFDRTCRGASQHDTQVRVSVHVNSTVGPREPLSSSAEELPKSRSFPIRTSVVPPTNGKSTNRTHESVHPLGRLGEVDRPSRTAADKSRPSSWYRHDSKP